MSLILTDSITGPAAWTGAGLADDQSWIHRLTAAEIGDLDCALAGVKAAGKAFPDIAKADFPLPGWAGLLARLADELEDGRGFMVFRGLPLERYAPDDLAIVYYGIGLNLGMPVRQNPRGDLLGNVMNVGDPADPATRVYETNAYLPYHTDPSDVVGLLCLRKAKAGGISSLVSVAAVYNRLLADCPEYLGLFYRPWYYAHLGEDLPSLSPLFSWHEGKLAHRYLRQYIELGAEVMGRPLSAVDVEALDRFDAIATDPALRLDMLLEPGDLQWANNYTILHSRTGFEDHPEPDRRRKKLRLWVKMANARALAPDFPGRNGFPVAGETVG